MSEMPTREEVKADEERYKRALEANGLDGPHYLGGDMFPRRGAICTICGALVLLDDIEEDGGRSLERGAGLHVKWHLANKEAPAQTEV